MQLGRARDLTGETIQPTWDEFKTDLGAALRAWRKAPALPVISVALFLTSYVPEPWWLLMLPALLFAAGWLGTERIWYLRLFRDEPIAAGELWRMTWAFLGRYLALGLLAGIVWSPVMILGFRELAESPDAAETIFSTPALWVTSVVLTVVIDFSLTFVTPALAFSTRSVREALKQGFGMLREHWPRSAWYALVPPLAVVIMLRMNDPRSMGALGVALSVGGALLNLWFKGATAAFYLRRVPVDSDGAAFARHPDLYEPEVAAT